MKIVVYGKPNCIWCDKSVALLTEKGFEFTYIDIEAGGFDKSNLTLKIAPGASTVPVILINNQWIGGYDQLKEIISFWEKDVELLKQLLKDGFTVTVYFTKKDGSTRTMECTTDFNKIPEQYYPKPKPIFEQKADKDPNLFTVFEPILNQWRSFKAQSLVKVSYS